MRQRSKYLTVSLALAVSALALVLIGRSAFQTEATTIGPGTMSLNVTAGAVGCSGGTANKPDKCTVAAGGAFSLAVAVNDFPAGGYIAFQTLIDWTGTPMAELATAYKPTTAGSTEIVWPQSALPARSVLATSVGHASASGVVPPFPVSTHKGNILVIAMNCTLAASTNPITLVLYTDIRPDGSQVVLPPDGTTVAPTSDAITINCGTGGGGATPTNTPTNTPPGATPTATVPEGPTNTPAPPTDTPPPGAATSTPTNTVIAPPTATRTNTPVFAPTATPPGLLGDVNCNGQVNSIDASLVLQYDARLISTLACINLADVNGDDTINAIDALYILWIDAGLYP